MRLSCVPSSIGAPSALSSTMSCSIDLALAALEARRDAVGALVDDREAEVLQHRHALRQPHGRVEAIDGGAHAGVGASASR